MQRDLIDILLTINEYKRPMRICIDFSQQRKCALVSCEVCPLFYNPEYLHYIKDTKEVIDE